MDNKVIILSVDNKKASAEFYLENKFLYKDSFKLVNDKLVYTNKFENINYKSYPYKEIKEILKNNVKAEAVISSNGVRVVSEDEDHYADKDTISDHILYNHRFNKDWKLVIKNKGCLWLSESKYAWWDKGNIHTKFKLKSNAIVKVILSNNELKKLNWDNAEYPGLENSRLLERYSKDCDVLAITPDIDNHRYTTWSKVVVFNPNVLEEIEDIK